MCYADILLPLAVPGAYTYRIPREWQGQIVVGTRVVVPIKTKRRTGIVVRLHDRLETLKEDQVRDIDEVVSCTPLLLNTQIALWRWMAHYYICHPGEVMKAALPAGLKLESESVLTVAEGADLSDSTRTEREMEVLRLLAVRAQTLDELQKSSPQRGLLSTVRQLMEQKVIEVEERISRSFKIKTEHHLRLAKEYAHPDTLRTLIARQRSDRQATILAAFLDLLPAASGSEEAALTDAPSLPREALRTRLGDAANAAIAALVKKGVLESFLVEVGRLRHHTAVPGWLDRPLSTAQQTACDAIFRNWNDHEVVLLHGVTSSGKTEIYTQLIRRTIEAGKQVLYLLPEIALTTQITERLGRCFGVQLGVYHSKFPDSERVELWLRQLSPNPYPLILGVRSALFLPFQNLGLIIVDEEHETSFKQQDPAPRYHARDVAIMMARQQQAKVLLGTATPSIETYTHALSGKYGLVRLEERYGEVELPEIVVEDVAELRRKRLMPKSLSPRLRSETQAALAAGQQAILFLNRRGYSPSLLCNSCGWTPRCQCCDVSLTYHQQANRLVCHYCGMSYDVPTHCPQCAQADLRDVGVGTEKVEAEVAAAFPEARIGRMDLDTTGTRSAYERIIRSFQKGETNLLVGTQMVTKGLDFDGVTLVGILNADQILNQCDFRAHERAFQMLTQVAGRAGRRGVAGRVILQTRQPELPIIRHIVQNDYTAMYKEVMAERCKFQFPPEVRLINILLKHRKEPVVTHAARTLIEMLRPYFPEQLFGPDRPAVGFVQMLHIRKIMLKIPPTQPPSSVRTLLNSARNGLIAVPTFRGTTVYFDVDPL